jgi:hypothetical protein
VEVQLTVVKLLGLGVQVGRVLVDFVLPVCAREELLLLDHFGA